MGTKWRLNKEVRIGIGIEIKIEVIPIEIEDMYWDRDWASKRKNRIPGYMTQGAMTRHIRVRWNDYTSIMASRRQGL
jgi:hypothetical protein